MKNATVKFIYKDSWSDAEYAYLTFIDDLEYGDYVVVEARDAYAVAVFMGYVDENTAQRATKYIVSKVETAKVEKQKEVAARKDAILKEIENRIQWAEKLERINRLAEKDPELKALLDELQELN